MATKRKRKAISTKETIGKSIWSKGSWRILHGRLKRGRGRPAATSQLFSAVAEKIPFEAIDSVEGKAESLGIGQHGVYVAHDSMGYARYVGRGNVFDRLKSRKKAQVLELMYFSFYIVANNQHEREIETLLIRAGGPQLHFNERKRRIDIMPGNVRDFEPGTLFFERQYKRGRRKKKKRGRPKKS
jgi:hypothetical protein